MHWRWCRLASLSIKTKDLGNELDAEEDFHLLFNDNNNDTLGQ